MRHEMKIKTILLAFAAVLALQLRTASAQQVPSSTSPGFSFAAYGDSRTMMYLPNKSDQQEEATKLMVEMFNLVLPEKIVGRGSQEGCQAHLRPGHR